MVTDENWSAEPAHEWVAGANCASTDPTIFFPGKSEQRIANQARRVCRSCLSEAECREYALERPDLDGIWGGLSTDQRRKIRKERR
jgi:WhiB family redox-sensing transcriptional regulator